MSTKTENKDAEQQEEEADLNHISVEKLKQHDISQVDTKRLMEANYHTVESVAYTLSKELLNIKGLSDAKVRKMQKAAQQLLPTKMTFKTAAEHYNTVEKNIIKITTGSKKFDQILDGGIEMGSITEIFGESRTGKTQICHMLCVSSQFPKNAGGGEGCAIYIDTHGTFRAKRIKQIADRFGMDAQDILNNIFFSRAYSSEHQMQLLQQSQSLLTQNKVALIVIDSATGLFRSEYIGRAEIATRQHKINQFLHELQKICDIFGVAAVITNQVKADPCGMGFGPSSVPIGGNIVAHASNTRISLRKGSKNTRIVRIYNSPSLAEDETQFSIIEGGIADP